MLYVAIRRVSVASATNVLIGSLLWLVALVLLAYNHFFQKIDARPPRFILVLGTPLLLIVSLLVTSKGRFWISQLPLSTLTRLHTVRIPVELGLYGLCVYHQVPQLITFEGRNFDILAGLTAPIIMYYVFKRRRLSSRGLLLWNILALVLVLSVVVQAILSSPLPFQQLAFEQPTVAILKAPYVWLPGFIVPAVLFAHAVAIQRLVAGNDVELG